MIDNYDWELLNARLEEIERSLGILQARVNTSLKEKYYPSKPADLSKALRPIGALADYPCVFDGMSKEDRMKAISVYCPCPKCSPYALCVGNFTDAGVSQVWSQPKALVDCISTTKIGEGNV